MFGIEYKARPTREGVMITISPELTQELILVLDALLGMARVVRSKATVIEASRRAKDPVDKARREEAFNKRSIEVLTRYQEHLAAGRTKQEAVQDVKKDFSIGYGDVQIYLVQGRKLTKPKKRPRGDRCEAEIQAMKEAA
jgi:hypothetical protein